MVIRQETRIFFLQIFLVINPKKIFIGKKSLYYNKIGFISEALFLLVAEIQSCLIFKTLDPISPSKINTGLQI